MIKNTIFTVLLFILIITVPYIADAGVELEPKYQENQLDWVDPNFEPYQFNQFYTSESGLKCENQIYQIYHLGAFVPARRCQLPDGAWFNQVL